MRNAGRLKLGYYPLPVEEAQNIRALLMSSAPYCGHRSLCRRRHGTA